MKKITSKNDFAIHGATPAYDEPIHVGCPNIGNEADFQHRVEGMLKRRWFTNNGPLLQELEENIVNYLGVKHCVAMCNGTIALEIAIRALGLSGEVIVPSYTFIATAHALYWQGITPVFADIDPSSHTLDPEAVASMVTPRTTGIIGVHLWGRTCEHSALQIVADEHGLKLLYDAAHAFGCSLGGEMIGNFGDCEVFSFHATKFFNSLEGGAVVTNNDLLAEKMRLMRNFGFSGVDNVIYSGTNGKMTEICAAMGLSNLVMIEELIEANRTNYYGYQDAIKNIPDITMVQYDEKESNNFQYVVLEVGEAFPADRDEIVETLQAENILARKYFWPGCHRMKPYQDLFPHSNLVLKITEDIAGRVIVLPTGISLPEECISTVASVLNVFSRKNS